MKVTNSLKYFMKNMSQFFHVIKKEKSANLTEFRVQSSRSWENVIV